jgi:hypothetical protein
VNGRAAWRRASFTHLDLHERASRSAERGHGYTFCSQTRGQRLCKATEEIHEAHYSDKDITLTGCLEKNKSGGFWLTHATSAAEPNSAATTTAPGATTADRAPKPSSTTADDKDLRSATAHRTWNLENGKNLDQYINQRIQVTGRAKNDTSGDELKGTTGGEIQARDFDVKSVRFIAASCS